MDRVINLIIEGDEPAIFYGDVESAEVDLEAIDVHNGLYRSLYGPKGEIYAISTDGDYVVITRAADQPDDPEGLANVLRTFLTVVDVPYGEDDTLEDLLSRCERFVEPIRRRRKR